MQEEDPVKKKNYSLDLLADFKQNVWVDYTTDISAQGHEQWEKFSSLYANLIKQHSTLFPTMIVVSPYLRTRLTAHYFLKNITWLDMDVDKLINEESIDDMLLWSFQSKDVVLQLSDEVRERDHGSDMAPSYLRKYINSFSKFHSLSWLPGDDIEQMYYYTSDGGWESQTQVNQRAKGHFNSLTSERFHKDIMVFSHHLYILWWLNSIFKWTYRTFKHFDAHRKPLNGSMSVFSKISQTQMWQENKLRVAGYNLMLDE
jgi:broad specificity phosphatase PhoE